MAGLAWMKYRVATRATLSGFSLERGPVWGKSLFFFFSGSLLATTGLSLHLRTDIHLVTLIIFLSDMLSSQLSVEVYQPSGEVLKTKLFSK